MSGTTGVVAQVWRDGSRQARLATLLRAVANSGGRIVVVTRV